MNYKFEFNVQVLDVLLQGLGELPEKISGSIKATMIQVARNQEQEAAAAQKAAEQKAAEEKAAEEKAKAEAAAKAASGSPANTPATGPTSEVATVTPPVSAPAPVSKPNPPKANRRRK